MSAVVQFHDVSMRAELARLEDKIRTGLRGSFEAGEALKKIRDDDRKLYRARDDGAYQTFEAYCQGVWNLSEPRAYQLIDAHETIVAISQTSTMVEVCQTAMTERMLRPLARLSSPDKKVAAFQAAVEFAATEGRPVTARHVAMAVQDIRKAAGRTSESFSDIIKPTDNWNFNPVRYGRIDGEDGHGYIPGDIYANCLWYYTKPDDIVAAPMAGSGQIMRVYEARHEWAIPEPWQLDIRMFDLNPRGRYADRITHNDLTMGLPVDRADYIVMDVPYFGMVEGQYSDKPEDLANMSLDAWLSAMKKIASVCAQVQESGTLCTVVCPNYDEVKTRRRIMTSDMLVSVFNNGGYGLFDKAYAARHIQQSQQPGMGQLNNMAKRNKTMLTDMAEVLTFRRVA